MWIAELVLTVVMLLGNITLTTSPAPVVESAGPVGPGSASDGVPGEADNAPH